MRRLLLVVSVALIMGGGSTFAEDAYLKLLSEGAQALKAGDVQRAIRSFSAAIKRRPKDPRGYYQRAVCYQTTFEQSASDGVRRAAAYDRAVADYRRSMALDARFAEPRNNLGALLFGRWEQRDSRGKKSDEARRGLREATILLRRAVALKPDYGVAWYNLGLVLSAATAKRPLLKQAVKAFRRAARLLPRAADVRSNLAAALQRLGDMAGARREVAKAVQLRPKDAALRGAYGELLQATGANKRAEEQFRLAIRLDPGYVRAQHRLALLLAKRGAFSEAIRIMTKISKRLPRDRRVVVLVDMGRVYRLWGKTDQAIKQYKEALQIDRAYNRAYLLMGLAHAAERRCKRARGAFERYVKHQPGLPKDALSRLMKRCRGQ